MLAEEDLDLVLICTPPGLHTEMVEAALEREVSIFVEKPFTLTAAEARRLLEKARSSGGTRDLAGGLCQPFQRRLHQGQVPAGPADDRKGAELPHRRCPADP